MNTSSNTAYRVTPFSGGYPASKAGIEQLTRIMSLELFPYGIRVNSVGSRLGHDPHHRSHP